MARHQQFGYWHGQQRSVVKTKPTRESGAAGQSGGDNLTFALSVAKW